MNRAPFSLKLILVLSFLSIGAAWADEEKTTEHKGSGSNSEMDTFRCVSMKNSGMADLKARLITECNVNKPFSLAATDIAVDSRVMYCCTRK